MQTVQFQCLAVVRKKNPRFLWVYQFLKTNIRHKISNNVVCATSKGRLI